MIGHLTAAAAAFAVVAVAVVMEPGPDSVVLFGVPLPAVCLFRNFFGMSCLGCGLTRSFAYMGDGNLAAAFELHVAGPALFAATLAFVPWSLRNAWRARERP